MQVTAILSPSSMAAPQIEHLLNLLLDASLQESGGVSSFNARKVRIAVQALLAAAGDDDAVPGSSHLDEEAKDNVVKAFCLLLHVSSQPQTAHQDARELHDSAM